VPFVSDAKLGPVVMELLRTYSCAFWQATSLAGEHEVVCSGRSCWGLCLSTLQGKPLMIFGLNY